MDAAVTALAEPLAAIDDLERAMALLAWDERTQMPPGGAAIRAEQLATLARIHHERATADGLGALIEPRRRRVAGAPEDSFEASLVRVARRDWEKTRRVPADLAADLARTTSLAEHAWEAARAASDFERFRPHLERVVELKRRYIECFEFDHPYDPLLDDFEPGMSTAELRPVLETLRDGLARARRRDRRQRASSSTRRACTASSTPRRRRGSPRDVDRRSCRSSRGRGGSTRRCTRSRP